MPHGALPPAARDSREYSRSVTGGVKIHSRDYTRTTLKPRHRPVVRALAEALFQGETPIPAARLHGFADEVDRFVSPASKTLRFGLVVVLDLIRWAPLFVVG